MLWKTTRSSSYLSYGNWLLAFFSLIFFENSYSGTASIPIVKSGSIVYLATQLEISTEDSVVKRIESLNNEYLTEIKKGNEANARSYYEKNSPSGKIPRINLYKEATVKEYGEVFIWGNFFALRTVYNFRGKEFPWREDYFCETEISCKRVITDALKRPGQFFEFSYGGALREKHTFKALDEAYFGGGKNSRYKIYDLKLGRNDIQIGRTEPPLRVGINAGILSSSICKSCSRQEFSSREEMLLLERFSSLFRELQTADIYQNAVLEDMTRKHVPEFELTSSAPTVSWKDNRPSLLFRDIKSYFRILKQWDGGRPLGYMKDDNFAYLFLDFTDASASEKNLFRMQIFILERDSSGNYSLLPDGSRDLGTRGLMFHDFTLKMLTKFFMDAIR